ncbi:synaptic vesicle glycoprotein 2B-like isoform X1 [Tribolium castaneum]|nr:PREDICTED: synaptic vesicle glycoprotein 2B-like isoform X1 [Tribolium castaneum]|eukprot:XP_015840824.1 PREDICTED: synaptic vesicle glycoprotein 2B-like isoform X1 [Tribolium castaneum]
MAPKPFKNFLAKNQVYNISSSVEGNRTKRQTSQREVYDADFETAISATKFGKFNIFLFLLSIPAGWTSMFETTTMSYVFPAAHCDLDLSLTDRGSLNAITFVGMVSSGFVWGFLCDTLGRKKLMVVGYLLDACFVILSSFSQNFTLLLIFKFFGGFIINGPFAALTAYLSEFHCSKYRSRVQLVRGMIVSGGSLTLPMLAWAILPQHIDLNIYNNKIVLHSWNIFLLVCAIPSLISGIIFMFLPESPKFLMTVGRNDEALEVFRKVYSFNTGKSSNDFPIKRLIDETKTENNGNEHGGHITANRTKSQALREGFQQIKPLCYPPHLKHIILVCLIQSLFMLSVNTLRLWLPQIFQSISDYKYYNNGTTSSLCNMLQVLTPKESNTTCHVNFSPTVYMNTMIIAAVSICGYFVAGTFINKLGKKLLLGTFSVASGLCVISIYFSQNTATVVTLSSLFLSLGGICGNVLITIVIDLFPTSLRTVTISLVMMLGRSASMVGNLIFPILLTLGCAPPFLSIGSVVIGCSLLTVLLPNTDLKALK